MEKHIKIFCHRNDATIYCILTDGTTTKTIDLNYVANSRGCYSSADLTTLSIAAGVYDAVCYLQLGAAKADTDKVLDCKILRWNGQQEITVGQIAAVKVVTDSLGAKEITLNSPAIAGGNFELFSGDDYVDNDRLLKWQLSVSAIDLAGATVELMLHGQQNYGNDASAGLTVAGTISKAGDQQTVTVGLTSAQTGALAASPSFTRPTYKYQLVITKNQKRRTIATGAINVNSALTSQ